MNKIRVILYILISLNISGILWAGKFKITSFYPPPYAGYDKLRFFPDSVAGMVCDASMEGLIFYNNTAHQLLVCKSVKGTYSWVNFEGVWIQEDSGSLGNVYLKDTYSKEFFVGIGTKVPEFHLTLDKGASLPDGGILAIGTYGSGQDLVTSGAGTRFIWYPKKAALRAGYVDGNQWDDVNIGDYSAAFGNSTLASGSGACALGSHTVSSGRASFSAGNTTVASGDWSVALGDHTVSSGNYSFSAGLYTEAKARDSIALGRYNVISGDSTTWIETDPLFVIGNGSDNLNRHNALTLLKNGSLGVNTAAVEFRLTLDKGANLPDGGILAIGTYGSGQDLVTSGAGTRFIWYPKKAALRAGYVGGNQWDDVNIGDYSAAFGNSTLASGSASFASGDNTKALGEASFATGKDTVASGVASFASGEGSVASGDYSFAAGKDTVASGVASFASGEGSVASGDYSFAAGYYVVAQAYDSVVFGRYNEIMGNSTVWQGTDPIFVIGNGTDNLNRHNAFTVLKNGNVGIGTSSPKSSLQVKGYFQLNVLLSSPPALDCSFQTKGRMVFSSSSGKLYICNGSNWVGF